MIVTASPSGNVNSTVIFNLFKDHVIPWLRGLGITMEMMVDLLGDLHSTHITVKLMNLLQAEYLFPLFPPGHSSHLTAPLDVRVFEILKGASKKCITSWCAFLLQKNIMLSIRDMPFVVQAAMELSHSSVNFELGFRDAGLFPLNPDLVLSKMPLPAGCARLNFAACLEALKTEQKIEIETESKSPSKPPPKIVPMTRKVHFSIRGRCLTCRV